MKDITERRQQEALQRWEAEHDPLTGLLNRRGFERRLEEAFADFQKTSTPSALLLFDLDHFKPINDEGGHALGDEMLRRIAQIVAWEVRRSDHVAISRADAASYEAKGEGRDAVVVKLPEQFDPIELFG